MKTLNNPGHTTKCVDWSYPSSPNAVKAGFGSTGCWTVSTTCKGETPKAVASFPERVEAITYAQSLPFKWVWYFLKQNPDVNP